MLSGKTVLVTGATGRLGAEISERLEALGAQVLPLVLPGYPATPKRAPWTASSVPIPIATEDDLRRLSRPDIVINLHWAVDRSGSIADQLVFDLTHNVLALDFFWTWLRATPPERFLNVSSIRVYGVCKGTPHSVHTPPRPDTPYGIAKLAAEHYFDALFRDSATQVTHTRLGPVASRGEHPSQLMSRLFASALRDDPITVNTGHATCLLHLHEAVDLLIAVAVSSGRRCYLVTGENLQNEDWAKRVAAAAGRELNADYADLQPDRPQDEFISDAPDLRRDWTRSFPPDALVAHLLDAWREQDEGATIE